MSPSEAQSLADVRGYAAANRIEFGPHARLRMGQRHAGREDVRQALMTGTSCHAEAGERWRVEGGRDRDGDELTAVVVFEDGVLVVTLF